MQISAKPLVLLDSAISRQIRKMVDAVTGKSEATGQKEEGLHQPIRMIVSKSGILQLE